MAIPNDGEIVEVQKGEKVIRGYHKNGRWFAEDGTPISVKMWRVIQSEAQPEPPPAVTSTGFRPSRSRRASRPA